MVSLSLLLGAAAALIGSTISAANLPQRRALSSGMTTIPTVDGNQTFYNKEYCRVSEQNARGWSRDGPLNMTIYEYPCPKGSDGFSNCTVIEQIATNIGPNDTVNWVVDVPVNITYTLVFEQQPGGGGLSQMFTTVPPSDNTDCDQSKLNLPFSAASLSNTTGLIGSPYVDVYSGAAGVVSVARTHTAALALVVVGVAAFL